MNRQLKKLGVHIPEILLPVSGTDLTKWAVIACDQYTSQPEYWENVRREVGASPSTLHLTFPEIYLKDDDADERIANINWTMEQYLEQHVLESQGPGFVLVDRSTPNTPSRKGLILALDLECYDYRPGAQTLIRATEGTVLERIPPRVKIRENASIELPHIMVLIDDPEKTVIERLCTNAAAGRYNELYDFELMQGGGHIKGWMVSDEESIAMVAQALETLLEKDSSSVGDGSSVGGDSLVGDGSQLFDTGNIPAESQNDPAAVKQICPGMLFAVGDGNHSLASAKAHWENVRASLLKSGTANSTAASEAPSNSGPESGDAGFMPEHPARYALVEIVNVHDDGIIFEPIHRVLFNIDPSTIMEKMEQACKGRLHVDFKLYDSKDEMEAERRLEAERKEVDLNSAAGDNVVTGDKSAVGDMAAACDKASAGGVHIIPFILEGRYGIMTASSKVSNLEVGTLQYILDELLRKDPSIEIDYIHGDEVVTELGSKPGSMGFYLPAMDKRDLFPAIKHDGVLPRKTFSMGEAEEKRYYLECRRIR